MLSRSQHIYVRMVKIKFGRGVYFKSISVCSVQVNGVFKQWKVCFVQVKQHSILGREIQVRKNWPAVQKRMPQRFPTGLTIDRPGKRASGLHLGSPVVSDVVFVLSLWIMSTQSSRAFQSDREAKEVESHWKERE